MIWTWIGAAITLGSGVPIVERYRPELEGVRNSLFAAAPIEGRSRERKGGLHMKRGSAPPLDQMMRLLTQLACDCWPGQLAIWPRAGR